MALGISRDDGFRYAGIDYFFAARKWTRAAKSSSERALARPSGIMDMGRCLSSLTSAVSTVVTAPVKVVGKTVDVMTTSQDEADRNRGRKAREAEEK